MTEYGSQLVPQHYLALNCLSLYSINSFKNVLQYSLVSSLCITCIYFSAGKTEINVPQWKTIEKEKKEKKQGKKQSYSKNSNNKNTNKKHSYRNRKEENKKQNKNKQNKTNQCKLGKHNYDLVPTCFLLFISVFIFHALVIFIKVMLIIAKIFVKFCLRYLFRNCWCISTLLHCCRQYVCLFIHSNFPS